MKLSVLVFAATVLIAGADDRAWADTRTSPQSSAAASEPAGAAAVRKDFLARLRRLAREGNLFEPESVARILNMKFQTGPAPYQPEPVACGDGKTKSFSGIVLTPSQDTWYRTLPTGAGHIDIPAFTINPATTTPDAAIEYRIDRSISCVDYPRLQDQKYAHIWFMGLPAFACLTPANILAEIPEAHFETYTDGVAEMVVDGRVNDDYGVRLNFGFRAGTGCAVTAGIKQDQEEGRRYLRANYDFEMCRRNIVREFCAQDSSFSYDNREKYKALVIRVYQRCGTTHTFYLKEPSNGKAPLKPPERNIRSPCSD